MSAIFEMFSRAVNSPKVSEFELFQDIKNHSVKKLVESAEEADSESKLLALAKQARTHSNQAKAMDRVTRTSDASTQSMMKVVFGLDSFLESMPQWTDKDNKKGKQLAQYLATGRAPGTAETACFAPMLESMYHKGSSMTYSEVSETIRKHRSLKEGKSFPAGDYVVNNYRSYLTLLYREQKGAGILTKVGEAPACTYSLTNKGKWWIEGAIAKRAR
jgi:hypothetical protein